MSSDPDDRRNVYSEAKAFQEAHPTVDVFPLIGKQPVPGVMWKRARPIDQYDWTDIISYGVVPKGYTVVDVDSADAGRQFEATYGAHPETLTVRSPNGVHIWLSGESEHRNAMLANLDIRSGDKGYIVGPGSIVGGGEYRVISDAPIAPLPERWRDAIQRPVTDSTALSGLAVSGSFQEMANEAGYNNALLSLKGKLVKLGVDEHIANEMVRSANRSLENPMDEGRLNSTVLARKEYAQGSFDLEEQRPEGGRLTTSRERRNRPPIRWLVEDIFPDHGVAQIVAPSMAGKSFAMIDLCLSVVNRDVDQWIGKPLNSHGSVVYVLSEGSLGFQRRIDAWTEAHPGTSDDNLYDLNAEEYHVDLSTPDGIHGITQDLLDAEIKDLKLIVIDTQGQLMASIDENSNSDWNAAVSKIKRLAKAAGCLIIFVHHSGNDKDTPRARGASAMLQSMDSALSMKMGSPGSLKITKVKEAEHGYSGKYELVPSGESVFFQWLGGDLAEAANNDRENLELVESAGKSDLVVQILGLLDDGVSIRQAADRLGCSASMVQRTKKAREERQLRDKDNE